MLEIRLLGQFDVRRDSAPVDIPSRPAQSLLAYLALHPGTPHQREKLAGLFWPDAAEANARSNLRAALWRIRKSLEGGPPAEPGYLLVDDIALGVAYYNEKNRTSVEVLGWDVAQQDGLFVGNFCCAAEGRQMAEKLMEEGADIILPVAGPTVGSGVAAAVQARGDAYLIGVDTDYTVTFPEYGDIMLTSIEKRVNVSVVAAVKAIVEGTFTGGTHVGTLENGGVGISPFHNLEALVSRKVKADLEQIIADIIAGKIKTRP